MDLIVSVPDHCLSFYFEIRAMRTQKEYAKKKLIERSGESDWRNGKYVRAISSLIACLHDIDVFLKNTSSLIEELLKCKSYLNGPQLVEGDRACLQKCKDYFEITDDSETEVKSTREIKGKTDVWLEMRKCAMVTGSTIHGALGLDGLAQ